MKRPHMITEVSRGPSQQGIFSRWLFVYLDFIAVPTFSFYHIKPQKLDSC